MESKAFLDQGGKLIIENGRIIYRNFSGAASDFNHEGDRNFCVFIDDPEVVAQLQELGWNVKIRKPRDEQDDVAHYIKVNVSYRYKEPKVVRHIGNQVIVVDDNSDKDVELLNQIISRYSGYVEFYKNDSEKKGAGSARNKGLSCADSKWLLFADSDDIFVPNWYEVISDDLDADEDIIFYKPTSLDSTLSNKTNRHVIYSQLVEAYLTDESRRNLCDLKYGFVVPWSKLIRKSIIDENFVTFEEVPFSNDMMFSVKSGFYAQKVACRNKTIYCVIEHDGSLTTNLSKNTWKIRNEAYCRKILFLKENLSKEDFVYASRDGFTHVFDAWEQCEGGADFVMQIVKYIKYRVPIVGSAIFRLKEKAKS